MKSLGLSFLKCLKVSVNSQNYLMKSNSAILYSCFALVLLSLTGQLIKSSLVIFSRQSAICFLYILKLNAGPPERIRTWRNGPHQVFENKAY